MARDIICFYHGQCVDGAASAAVIRYKYPQAKCYPLQYGDPLPVSVKNKTLFVVDFSFDIETFTRFQKEAREVFWYDHHKTALPTHQALGWGVLDMNESGASLTWKQEYPRKKIPKILQYVKDKDIWQWKLPHSRAVNAVLRDYSDIHNPSSVLWSRFLKGITARQFGEMVRMGEHSIHSQQLRLIRAAKDGFEIKFHGHKAMAVNWSQESSEMGEYIYKTLGYPVALMFHYTGKFWRVSLRSNRVDVSVLAQKYGGGGHAGAAGFQQNEIGWLLKMKK